MTDTFEKVGKGQITQALAFRVMAVFRGRAEGHGIPLCFASQSGCHGGWIRSNPFGLQQNKWLY